MANITLSLIKNITIATGLCLCSSSLVAEHLYVDLMFSSGTQKTIFNNLTKQFAKENPSITVVTRLHQLDRYVGKLPTLVTNGHPDILFGQAGEKFTALAGAGFVEPLAELWTEQDWYQQFNPKSQAAVSYHNKPYALPIAYYYWGIYYRKSIFSAYNLTPPQTWDELLAVSRVLQSHGITPFSIASKDSWAVAAWFDYLNLRINGLAFHRQLMAGLVSYNDARVKDVFLKWQFLLDNNFFLANHQQSKWEDSLPYIYRGKAGMVLMGSFMNAKIPAQLADDIGFFRFPRIKKQLPFYEDAPLDILAIPALAQNKAPAKRFLAFMGRKDILEKMNKQMMMISPLPHEEDYHHPISQQGAQVLANAAGLAQFYDRDTRTALADPGKQLMVEFINNPNQLESILNKLEALRHAVYDTQ